MFDTKSIGKKIVHLRKINNITQMELADLMGVSYQAVSNWERGNSMPDISKLPELAKIFNTSVDNLLSEEKSLDLIKNVIEGEEENYLKKEKTSIKEIVEITPILKPAQTETMLNKVIDNIVDNKGKITIKEIAQVASSIDEDYLFKLIKQVNEKFTIEDLCDIAPYLDESDLYKLLLEAIEYSGTDGLEKIAPYIDEDDLNKIIRNNDIENISNLYPYLSEETINCVAIKAFENEKFDEIIKLVPYMDDDDIDSIAIKAAKCDYINLVNNLAPYVDEDAIHDVADILVKKHGITGIKGIAHYL